MLFGRARATGIVICTVVAAITSAATPAGTVSQSSRDSRIDELCQAKWKEKGLAPSEVCPDEVFLRRVYLDTIGILPAPDEARAFLADKNPDKRAKLIDRLLQKDEFADFWTLKWGDLLRIKSEYPVKLWPKAVQAYYRWVRESIAENKPYDKFVTEMLMATGSNFRDGPCNFYRAVPNKDPQSFAESAALVFMGVRISCARCHVHPTEKWTLDDSMGMAAFFAQVKFKQTGEWKEEIVYVDTDAVLKDARTRQTVKPRFLGGQPIDLKPGEDARQLFAAWLTSPENPYFSRAISNRVWFWLLGRGIVHEADDLRPGNPPSNPALLDYLAKELVDHKYDLKHIYRIILNSRVYQLSSKSTPANQKDVVYFSHYLARRLEAEQLLDAISQVTETTETFASIIPEPYTKLSDFHAIWLSDGSIGSPFLELFGRPPRDTPFESERCNRPSMRQALQLLNSNDIDRKVAASGRIKRLLADNKTTDAQILEEIYLAAFSRLPTDAEKTKVLGLMKDRKPRQQAVGDLLWAVLNAKEFLFNH
ncbi:MAG: DUF1549 and DUF1553 domain-containing protein [Tepidisphaeraceae bacterium]